ncbi:MAG TPA: translation elongation factor Ts [Candidatus Kapabacteria bacterium]|jgi:elongation factor Ts|nr:translation elongation factor Ts [Candidatus Kapabacteria bacterium]
MAISAQDVKSLRDRTGAGMADCKKALEESNGDMNAAIEFLRKKGAATAAKRADKTANEGVVATAVTPDHKRGAIVEVNCETDFVARNEEFSTFVRRLAQAVLDGSPSTQDELQKLSLGDITVETAMHELLGKFSERIEVRRFGTLSTTDGYIADYVHHGDKLGVLIELSGAGDVERTNTLARDVAMQVAAMNPGYVNRTEVPESIVAKEREIFSEQTAAEGKKPEIAEKIVNNRVEKFYGDVCLVEQSFVKDSAKTIKEILADFGKAEGVTVDVRRFVRFNLGESMPVSQEAETAQ